MFAQQADVNFYTSYIHDLEGQLLDNNMALRIANKYSSSEIDNIQFKTDSEEDIIRNEMDAVDDVTSQEYEDLMMELNELKDEEDRQVSKIERESKDYQTEIEQENALVETQLEAARADKDAIEDNLKENVENVFGYFQ